MNLSIKRISLLSLLAVALFAACKKQEYQSIEELDAVNIETYIRENNLSVEPLGNTGMYYQILEEGKGSTLSYTGSYPIVYTVKSLDGIYNVADTFATASRYFDYLGYFQGESPQGAAIANIPSYQGELEKDEGLKMAVRSILQKTDGKIRVLVPSRLMDPGRNGNTDTGIPSNASMDFVIQVLDSASLPAYEDLSIRKRMEGLGLNLSEYEKTESGIYYHISEQGDGDSLTVDSTITCSFVGALFNGSEFTKSDSTSIAIGNTGNPASWKEILPKLNKGGSVRFFSPSSVNFGLSAVTGVPPFSSTEFQFTIRDDDEE